MNNQNRQRIFLIVILFVILIAGVGIFQSLTKKKPSTPTPVAAKPVSLTDYVDNSDAQVRLTIVGHTVAKEHHLDQTITISIANRDLEITRGYSSVADLSSGFDNNQPAFEDFATALSDAGFTRTITPRKAVAASETGLCPSGYRYDYDLIVGGQTLYHAWSTSCGDPTTFGGQASVIQTLFTNQIPDYNKLVYSVKP